VQTFGVGAECVSKILASTDQRVVQLDRAVVPWFLGFLGSLLLFLIGQGAMAIWWASEINTRIANVEGISKARDTLPERVARLETIASNVSDRLARIDTKLDRLIDRASRTSDLKQAGLPKAF
jgi:hypothetical protein